MKRPLLFLALLVALAAPMFWLLTKAQTTNYYVLAAAAPGGDGSAWGTAFQCIPTDANLVRGAIYWIGPGDYRELCDGAAARTFTKTANGSTITFRRATDSNHGPAVDWGTACVGCGSGQAIFHPLRFQTNDWSLDGQTRTDYRTGYLLRVTSVKPDGVTSYNGAGATWVLGSGCNTCGSGGTSASNITFQYIQVDGTRDLGANRVLTENGIRAFGKGTVLATNIYVGYNSLSKPGNSPLDASSTLNLVEEFNWLAYDWSQNIPTQSHAEGNALHGSLLNTIIRYNIFEDIFGTADIAFPNSGATATPDGFYIYGNLFIRSLDNPEAAGGLGNGTIAVLSCTAISNLYVYNNTTVNMFSTTSGNPRLLSVSPQTSTTSPCWPNGGSVFNFTAENNLWYSNSNVDNGSSPCSTCTGTYAWDYNSYYDTTATTDLSANAKFYSGVNPFVGYSSKDFRLAIATDSGITLAAPYNLDPLGVTRGADGNWDRGTFELAGSGAAGSCSESLTLTASAAASRAGAGVARKACKP